MADDPVHDLCAALGITPAERLGPNEMVSLRKEAESLVVETADGALHHCPLFEQSVRVFQVLETLCPELWRADIGTLFVRRRITDRDGKRRIEFAEAGQ
jgi:hypothetical protein